MSRTILVKAWDVVQNLFRCNSLTRCLFRFPPRRRVDGSATRALLATAEAAANAACAGARRFNGFGPPECCKRASVAGSVATSSQSPSGLASNCSKMLFRCAVSDAVSSLQLGRLLNTRVRLTSALSSHKAREVSVAWMGLLLRWGRSPEWLRHHCLNSLQRSKSSLHGGAIGEWKQQPAVDRKGA